MKNYVVLAESDFEGSEKIAKIFSLNAALSNMSNMSNAAVCVTGRPLVSSTWGFQLFTSEDLCRALALRKAALRLKKAASSVSVFQGFRNLTSRRSRHHEAAISSAQLPQAPSSTKEKARKLSGPAVQCSASGQVAGGNKSKVGGLEEPLCHPCELDLARPTKSDQMR